MDNTPQQGSLERLGIPVETTIDENILTEGGAKSVRFRSVKVPGVSKPLGYSFGEVDKFVQNIVIPSLGWYQTTLHEKDKQVFKLGEALDALELERDSLKEQLQSVEYNASIRKGLQTFSEDKEVATLLQRLKTTESELEAARAGMSEQEKEQYLTAIQERDEYIATITQSYTEMEALLAQQAAGTTDNAALETATAEKAELEAQIALLVAQVAALEAKNEEEKVDPAVIVQYEEHVATITGQYEELMAQYTLLSGQYSEALAVANAKPEIDPAVVAQYEGHIATLTGQYEELTAQHSALKDQYAEALKANETVTNADTLAQYEGHIATITAQYEELMGQYNDLNERHAAALAATAVAPAVDSGVISQYESHIAAITGQYNELLEQYTTLSDQYTAALASAATPNVAEMQPDVQELYQYIETITAQYEQLSEAYTELQNNVPTDENSAEVGRLKVALTAAQAEIERLEALLDEYEQEEAEEEKPVARIPLHTEKRPAPPLPPQLSNVNLPSGIRPEDLV